MSDLCVATRNPGKQREFRELLADWPVRLWFPQELGLDIEVEEKGDSFADIALLKATTYARATGMLALADDSGLEVDALDGAPGLYTARYAGPDADDHDRRQKLLRELEGLPLAQRTARFRCAIALATPDGRTLIAEGTCEGLIALAPRGSQGFGYDPIFYLPQFRRTMAELPPEIKNEISHRGRAVQAARSLLDALLKGEKRR